MMWVRGVAWAAAMVVLAVGHVAEVWGQPVPAAVLAPAGDIAVPLGESFGFSVAFDNAASTGSGEIGYAPVLELVLPPEVTLGTADAGIFGLLSAATNVVVPGSGEVTNPVTGETLSGLPPGASYVVFELPVGSFSPDQAAIDVAMTATLASTPTPGVPLDTSIVAIGLFSLGMDPLDNAGADPVVRGDASTIWSDDSNAETGVSVNPAPAISGSATDSTVTPTIYQPSKRADTRFGEMETTSGPNFPITYSLAADVADGATVNSLAFNDVLADNFHFAAITGVTVNGSSGDPVVEVTFTPFGGLAQILYNGVLSGLVTPLAGPTTTPPGGDPGGTLEVSFGSIVGEVGDDDVVVEFEGYVPELDTAGDPVIDPATGGDATVSNGVTASADSATGDFGSVDLSGMDEVADPVDVTARNIAIQKSVELLTDNEASGLSPGDIVRFTIEGQVSDYFSHDNMALQDVLGDGYDFNLLNPGNPMLTLVTENGVAGAPVAFTIAALSPAPDISTGGSEYPFPAAATLLVTQNAQPGEASGTTPGFTTLVFDLSAVLGSPFDGGAVDASSNADGTTLGIDDESRFQLTFDATVQSAYENPNSFVGTADIAAGDALSNDAAISGRIQPSGNYDGDDTAAGQSIATPTTAKELVAVNGGALPVPLEIRPGDSLTYSYQFTVPTGTLETAEIYDFLPLPVFDVEDPNADGIDESWVFSNSILAANTYPAAGIAAYGPSTTSNGDFDPTMAPLPPTVDTDPPENALLFLFPASGAISPTPSQEIVIEILYTVTASDQPFADRLRLCNVVQSEFENSVLGPTTVDETDCFTLREPNLVITKGVSATSGEGTIDPSPATQPVDGDLAGADAGDTVTYVITVENVGGAEAFNVVVTDPAVAGLTACAIDSVTDGTISPLATSGDLSSGLELAAPLAENDGSPGAPYSTDTALITVTCTVDTSVVPCAEIENVAAITNFAGVEGGPSHVDPDDLVPYQDEASVVIDDPGLSKSSAAIAPNGGGGSDVTAGDVVTYEVVVTLPEAFLPQLVLSDVLPTGFAYVPGTVSVTPGSFNGSDVSAPAVATGPPLEVQFGDVTVAADNDPTTNQFVVAFDARVLDDGANDGLPSPQMKTNTVSLDFTDSACGDIEATASTDFIEPEVEVTKSIMPNTADAGDMITVTITYENTGTSRLYDPVISDSLDPAFIDLTSVVVPTPQGDLDCGYVSPTVTCVDGAGFTFLAPGDSRTVTFTAVMADDVVAGTTYENTASGTGDSQGGAVDEERSTADEGSAIVNAARAEVVKRLTATSESFTDPGDAALASTPPVAIGEVVDVEIDFTMPEGVLRDVQLIDVLQGGGLRYITGSATLSRNSAALFSAADPGAINTDGGGVLGDPVAVVMNGVTGQVSLAMGDVTNTDTDNVTPETYTLRLRAVVANRVANVAGAVLPDRGRLRWEDGLCRDERTPCSDDAECTEPGDSCGTGMLINSSRRNVRVAEPVIDITKTATPLAAESGDVVSFTLLVANTGAGANATDGFEWLVSDVLPPEYFMIGGPVVDQSDAPGAVVSPCGFAGNVLTCEIDRLQPGESVEITYTAEISIAAEFGQMIMNTAMVEASSLPGDNGNGPAPGASGSLEGERDASGGANDLRDSDDAVVEIGTPTIDKQTVDPQAYYAIGDRPVYQLILAVPQGSTDSFVVVDELPDGLSYVAGSLQAVLPAGVASTMGTSPLSEGDAGFFDLTSNVITLDFGDLTAGVAGDIVVTYTVLVDNVIDNQDGTLLENVATLTFDDPNDPGASIVAGPVFNEIRVGEPNLEMEKTITSGAVDGEAGDVVSWSVRIANVLHTTAHRVVWADVLPGNFAAGDGLEGISNPMLVTAGGTVTRSSDLVPLSNADLSVSTTNNTDDTIALPEFELPPGAELTITFDCVFGDNVVQGAVLDNATRASYDSQLTGADGRDNSSGPGTVDDDDDSDLDNYEESASQAVTVLAEVAIDKTVDPVVYTIGQQVDYQVRVDFIEGVTEGLRLVDILPAGLTLVDFTIAVGNPGIGFSNGSYDTNLGTGQTLELFFGNVSNPDNGEDDDDFLTVEISARVDNVVGNQNGTVLRNGEAAEGSELFIEVGPDDNRMRLDFDHDASTAEANGIPIVLIEPDLSVDKTMLPSEQSLGDIVHVVVQVAHTAQSTANAFDVAMVDSLPEGLTYVEGSATLPAGDVEVLDAPTNRSIEFRVGSLPLAQGDVIFSYQARIDLDAVADAPLSNLIELTWAGLPGATGDADGGRNGDDGIAGALNDYANEDSATVVPTTNSTLDAVKTVEVLDDADGSGTVTPGDTLGYTVTLLNRNGILTGIVFTDTVPVETTYVGGTLTSSAGVADDSGAPTLRVDIPALAANGSVTIEFSATVNDDAPPCRIISNQGSVDSAETIPEPTDWDGYDANGDQPTDVLTDCGGSPNPSGFRSMTLTKDVALTGDNDVNGIINEGDEVTYSMVIFNPRLVPLTNVMFSDVVPPGANPPGISPVTGVTTTQGTAPTPSNNVVIADIGTIPPGGSVIVTITGIVNGVGTVVNVATATADGDLMAEDDAIFTAEETGVSEGDPELVVDKEVAQTVDANGDGMFNPGEALRYTITVQNIGSAPATNVILTDPLPGELDFVSVSTSGVVIQETPVLIVNLGTMQPGAVQVLTIEMTIPMDTPTMTTITNVVTVTDNEGDEATDMVDIIVISLPDLAIDKSGPTSVAPEERFSYLIRVTNVGMGPTTGLITVTDSLPMQVVYVSGGGNGWTCGAVGQDVTCTNPGPLAPGESTLFPIRVEVVAFVGSFVNTAEVDTPGDEDPDNDEDSHPIEIIPPAPAPALDWFGLALGLSLLLLTARARLRPSGRRVRAGRS